MKTLFFGFVLLSLSVYSATIKDEALKYVPGGKVIKEKTNEIKVRSSSGTVVEIKFTKTGKLEEASGTSVDNDIFLPGNYLMTLKDMVASASKAGKKPVGEWSLENSKTKGWYYEFKGWEHGKRMDYLFDAKSGKILDSKMGD